jgi:hypothetical protein
MTFEGNRPPMTVPGHEGFFLNNDGTLGDYFIETYGQVQRIHKLGEGSWASSADADPRELKSLGFANVSSARHVLVKVVTSEQGVETHRISRVTTVQWKDSEGKDRALQFVSLQGFHKRQSESK